MKVLIAPDSFKGSLCARDVAKALASGLPSAFETVLIPLGDGGEGSLEPFYDRGIVKEITVQGPLRTPVLAKYVLCGKTAYIESAQACGITLLEPSPRTALEATTRGVGELIRAAIGDGAERIVLFLGGTATTDGGKGALEVLQKAPVELLLACDVDNPLCGPRGAAAVFSPQKGARGEEVAILEERLLKWAKERHIDPFAPHFGAAGGLAAGLSSMFCHKIASGFDIIADEVKLDEAIAACDIVFSGEGSIDSQSPHGKLLDKLSRRCARYKKPLYAFAGRIMPGYEALLDRGLTKAFLISTIPDFPNTAQNLRKTVEANFS